jgi:hypothetical protein
VKNGTSCECAVRVRVASVSERAGAQGP